MQIRVLQLLAVLTLVVVSLEGQSTSRDTGFAAMQTRGRATMGVDQYASTHRFDTLPDGGRIELQSDRPDSVAINAIRQHLQTVAQAFQAGDFSAPAFVHRQPVPGSDVMAAKRAVIRYRFSALARGGEVRIVTSDTAALQAIHEFLSFQRDAHHAEGTGATH